MAKIIAVINQKGGVGKTATTCHLAYAFAGKNKSTLLVDMDPSANATSMFIAPPYPLLTVKDFILSKDILPITALPAMENGETIMSLSVIGSHIGLAMVDKELTTRAFRETLLDKKLRHPAIFNHFDYIFIDCPPTLSTLTINAMYAADFILIPVTYAKNALEGVADLFDVLAEIKEGQQYDIRILRNQYDARKKTVNGFIAENLQPLIEQGKVLKTIIRQDEAVNRATLENLTVFNHCPHTYACADYLFLRDELQEIFNG